MAPAAQSATISTVLPSLDLLEQRAVELMELWRVPPGPPVRVTWNRRLTTTAGRAFPTEHRVELNPELLSAHPAQVEPILVHETAHVAAHRLFGPGVAAHGRHWRGLMRIAGQEPEVSHDLPVPHALRRRPRHYLYLRVCDVCGDRVIARSVHYAACPCGETDRFLVLRTSAVPQGLALLRAMTLAEVRRRCIMARKQRDG